MLLQALLKRPLRHAAILLHLLRLLLQRLLAQPRVLLLELPPQLLRRELCCGLLGGGGVGGGDLSWIGLGLGCWRWCWCWRWRRFGDWRGGGRGRVGGLVGGCCRWIKQRRTRSRRSRSRDRSRSGSSSRGGISGGSSVGGGNRIALVVVPVAPAVVHASHLVHVLALLQAQARELLR